MSLITKGLRVSGSSLRLPAIVLPSTCNKFRPFYRAYSVTQKQVPKKIAAEKMLPQIFKFVDQNVESYKALLKDAVAIPSVSSDPKYRDDCIRMAHWMRDKLKEVGASTELRDVGSQTIDGKEIQLPPVLVGSLGNVCLYFIHN